MTMRVLLAGNPILPVIVIDKAEAALELMASLAEGGLLVAEVTLRTPAGLDAIRRSAGATPIIVGAGTVLTAAEVDEVVDAGARFIVSPGLDERVIQRAAGHGIPVLPGVATASEVQRALGLGLELVKFFPADRLGGLPTIAALAAPFGRVGFVPSGGVSAANAGEYLAHDAVPAVSGSWMAPRELVRARAFADIAALSRAACALGRSA